MPDIVALFLFGGWINPAALSEAISITPVIDSVTGTSGDECGIRSIVFCAPKAYQGGHTNAEKVETEPCFRVAKRL